MGRPIDQLYEQLKAAGKIGMVPPQTYPKGFPTGYDPQTICTYHSRNPSHSTDNCRTLKRKIQDMIDAGDIILSENGESWPNVRKNPLPEHKDTVGAITADKEFEQPTKYTVGEKEVSEIDQKPFVLEGAI